MPTKNKEIKCLHKNIIKCNSSGNFFLIFSYFFLVEKPNRFNARYLNLSRWSDILIKIEVFCFEENYSFGNGKIFCTKNTTADDFFLLILYMKRFRKFNCVFHMIFFVCLFALNIANRVKCLFFFVLLIKYKNVLCYISHTNVSKCLIVCYS